MIRARLPKTPFPPFLPRDLPFIQLPPVPSGLIHRAQCMAALFLGGMPVHGQSAVPEGETGRDAPDVPAFASQRDGRETIEAVIAAAVPPTPGNSSIAFPRRS